MSTPSPCAGQEFVLDSQGNLRVQGANQLPWPFLPSIRSGNGLYVDSLQGVWTSPHGIYRTGGFYSATGLSVAVASGTGWKNPATSGGTLKPTTITNPSDTLSMCVYAWCNSYVTGSVGVGTAASHRASVSLGAVSAVMRLGACLNPTGNGSTVYTWTDRRKCFPQYTPHGQLLSPGASYTYWPNQEVWAVGSNLTITGWENWTVLQGILIDATQAGVAS